MALEEFSDNRKTKVTAFSLPPNIVARLEKATARTLEEHDRIPTVEEIREVLKVANPLEKAMILVGCSSGLSANEQGHGNIRTCDR